MFKQKLHSQVREARLRETIRLTGGLLALIKSSPKPLARQNLRNSEHEQAGRSPLSLCTKRLPKWRRKSRATIISYLFLSGFRDRTWIALSNRCEFSDFHSRKETRGQHLPAKSANKSYESLANRRVGGAIRSTRSEDKSGKVRQRNNLRAAMFKNESHAFRGQCHTVESGQDLHETAYNNNRQIRETITSTPFSSGINLTENTLTIVLLFSFVCQTRQNLISTPSCTEQIIFGRN